MLYICLRISSGLTSGVRYNTYVTAINGIIEQLNVSSLEQILATPASSNISVVIVVVVIVIVVALIVIGVLVIIVVIM